MATGSSDQVQEYDFWTDLLAVLWGEGFLAPGGAENVRRTVEGLDLNDKSVLDFGCGAGGPATILAGEFGANVTAIDIDPHLTETTQKLAEKAGLSERILVRTAEPGALPFDDESFDLVFSSGVFIHIPNKQQPEKHVIVGNKKRITRMISTIRTILRHPLLLLFIITLPFLLGFISYPSLSDAV